MVNKATCWILFLPNFSMARKIHSSTLSFGWHDELQRPGGGGGETSYRGQYGQAPPEDGVFFKLAA